MVKQENRLRYRVVPAPSTSTEELTARAVVERLLYGTVGLLTDTRTPQGCLMIQAALACGKGSDSIRQELNSRRRDMDAVLCRRLVQARATGDLPSDGNAADLACYVATVMRGMAVQTAGGASSKDLRGITQIALRAWP